MSVVGEVEDADGLTFPRPARERPFRYCSVKLLNHLMENVVGTNGFLKSCLFLRKKTILSKIMNFLKSRVKQYDK